MQFAFLNGEIESLKYYRFGNLASHVFVDVVKNSIDLLEKNLQILNGDIVNNEDLFRYLWLFSFHDLVNDIDEYKYLDDSMRDRIKELDKKIDRSPKFFINFINKNYKEFFVQKVVDEFYQYGCFDLVLDLIFNKYSNGIVKDVFDYIEKEFSVDLLLSFDLCSSYFKHHAEDIKVLFEKLDNLNVFEDIDYCYFLLNYKNKENEFLKEKAKFICERAIEYIKKQNYSSENKDIIYIYNMFSFYRKLSIIENLTCANEYNEYKKVLDNLVEEYMKKQSKSINLGTVDFNSMLDEFRKDNNDCWRFLGLTHCQENGIKYNSLNSIFEVKCSDPLMESIEERLGQPSSDKYPYYKQDVMEIDMGINYMMLRFIILDPELSPDFADYVYNLSKEVEEKFFRNAIELSDETLGIFEMVYNAIDLSKDKQENAYFYKAFVNGCVMNECGLLEKLLRNVAYFDQKDEGYYNPDKNTIGTLMQYKYQNISPGLMYYLEYYLSTEANGNLNKEERPGLNIRNI